MKNKNTLIILSILAILIIAGIIVSNSQQFRAGGGVGGGGRGGRGRGNWGWNNWNWNWWYYPTCPYGYQYQYDIYGNANCVPLQTVIV